MKIDRMAHPLSLKVAQSPLKQPLLAVERIACEGTNNLHHS